MNGPAIVCSLCHRPTTVFKPICDECNVGTLHDDSVAPKPKPCSLCMVGWPRTANRLQHYAVGGGYVGPCQEPDQEFLTETA